MNFDQLCELALTILKQTRTRRSAQAMYDVFYHMWAEGSFDGYGQGPTVNTNQPQFADYFYNNGNSDVYDNIKAWYRGKFGSRKQVAEVKTVTVSVGDLLQESDKAYCFHSGKFINGKRGPIPAGIWVPKSQVDYNDEAQELTMPIWLAKEKNYMRGS